MNWFARYPYDDQQTYATLSASARNRLTRRLDVKLSTETTHPGYFAHNSMHFPFQAKT